VSAEFILQTRGLNYGGWMRLNVTRSIEQLAHSFEAELTDRWFGGKQFIPLKRGDAVKVVHRDDKGTTRTVITGVIDKTTLKYDATSRTITIAGRSLTGDLVDCAAIHKGGWTKASILTIAKDLCDPFGISVASRGIDPGPVIPWLPFTDGDTPFQILEKAARMRGLLMTTGADGMLLFEKVGRGKISTTLRFGDNVLEGERADSMDDRFSEYIVKVQASGRSLDGDTHHGKNLVQKAISLDAHVLRYRPTIVTAESNETDKQLQVRADWERNVKAGRSTRLNYLVDGWEHATGLWEPNMIVRVEDKLAEVSSDLLIISTTHTAQDGDGYHTRLELADPSAYQVEPLPPLRSKTGLRLDP
jgi:prophage tail gpP-like protein